MNITSAQYRNNLITGAKNAEILATIDGEEGVVPIDPDNRHYAEILKQVADGTLTIQEAD